MTDMPLLHFTSVPMLRRRASGWSPAAQRAFIDMLARCGVVAQAARSVGCSPRSAYQLRQKQGAESFAAAWDWALEMGLDAARAQAIALTRCAQVRPIVRRGVVVGHRRAPDNRVMLAAMRTICAERSGARKHEVMAVMAKPLTDEDIANLAAWFASIRVEAQAPQ